jgi:hypothetical protein
MSVNQQQEVLILSFAQFDNNWNSLQQFLEQQAYPPYIITDNMDLSNSNVVSLGNLISVEGNLYLQGSSIESLGSLESVNGGLDLCGTPIRKS